MTSGFSLDRQHHRSNFYQLRYLVFLAFVPFVRSFVHPSKLTSVKRERGEHGEANAVRVLLVLGQRDSSTIVPQGRAKGFVRCGMGQEKKDLKCIYICMYVFVYINERRGKKMTIKISTRSAVLG